MQYTTAGGHAACGDDDARRLHVVDLFRFVGGAREMKLVNVERVALAILVFASEFEIVIFAVFQIQIGSAEGHGAVDVNGEPRNALLIFELAQVIHKGLCAADGEGGNDDGAAALGYAIYDSSEEFGGIAGCVFAIAVSGFAEKYVRVRGGRGWIIQDGLVVAADIAGENYDGFLSIVGNRQDQTGGAEDVAGIIRLDVKFRADVEAALARHRFHGAQNGIDVVRSVERLRVCVAAVAFGSGAFGVVFLEMRGVFQEKSREVDGRGVRENGSAVAVFDEAREQTGVIQVSVS